MRFRMAKVGVFRLLFLLIRPVNREIESIAILAIQDCIKLLLVEPKQLFNGGREFFH